MKNRNTIPVLSAILLLPISLFAQGSLTPPGPPAPIMKTLQQIEPRTDVQTLAGDAASLHIISTAGSYYLTANIAGVASRNGITIAADNVTLDLSGFEVAGVALSLTGIRVSGTRTNVAVHNGVVRNWAVSAIEANTVSKSCRFSDLRISANGQYGIHAGAQTAVERCLVSDSGNSGISVGIASSVVDCIVELSGNPIAASGIVVGDDSMVRGSTSRTNDQYGISAGDNSVIRDCSADGNGVDGILTALGANVSRCSVRGNASDGIDVSSGSVVADCASHFNGADGIEVSSRCSVLSSVSYSNAGNGIRLTSSGTVKDCNSSYNYTNGIYAVSRCLIVGNTCEGNPVGIYTTSTGSANRIEENVVTASGTMGIWVGMVNGHNVVVKNSAVNNVGTPFGNHNYSVPNGNVLGPIISRVTGQASVLLNVYPDNHAWANFGDPENIQ